MPSIIRYSSVLAGLVVLATSAEAQWLGYPAARYRSRIGFHGIVAPVGVAYAPASVLSSDVAVSGLTSTVPVSPYSAPVLSSSGYVSGNALIATPANSLVLSSATPTYLLASTPALTSTYVLSGSPVVQTASVLTSPSSTIASFRTPSNGCLGGGGMLSEQVQSINSRLASIEGKIDELLSRSPPAKRAPDEKAPSKKGGGVPEKPSPGRFSLNAGTLREHQIAMKVDEEDKTMLAEIGAILRGERGRRPIEKPTDPPKPLGETGPRKKPAGDLPN